MHSTIYDILAPNMYAMSYACNIIMFSNEVEKAWFQIWIKFVAKMRFFSCSNCGTLSKEWVSETASQGYLTNTNLWEMKDSCLFFTNLLTMKLAIDNNWKRWHLATKNRTKWLKCCQLSCYETKLQKTLQDEARVGADSKQLPLTIT